MQTNLDFLRHIGNMFGLDRATIQETVVSAIHELKSLREENERLRGGHEDLKEENQSLRQDKKEVRERMKGILGIAGDSALTNYELAHRVSERVTQDAKRAREAELEAESLRNILLELRRHATREAAIETALLKPLGPGADMDCLRAAKDVCCRAHAYEEAAAIRDMVEELRSLRAEVVRLRLAPPYSVSVDLAEGSGDWPGTVVIPAMGATFTITDEQAKEAASADWLREPNIRPVSIDPDGTLRETDGTLIPPIPGLEPESVREGAADVEAGRTRPLGEIVADRDSNSPLLYVASRASVPERPAMWRRLRECGWRIVASWIDEAGEGETADLGELWARIETEIRQCDGLILYAEGSDFPLKGALVEVGIAIGAGKPVAVVMSDRSILDPRSLRPLGSWAKHPRCCLLGSVDDARDWIAADIGRSQQI